MTNGDQQLLYNQETSLVWGTDELERSLKYVFSLQHNINIAALGFDLHHYAVSPQVIHKTKNPKV